MNSAASYEKLPHTENLPVPRQMAISAIEYSFTGMLVYADKLFDPTQS